MPKLGWIAVLLLVASTAFANSLEISRRDRQRHEGYRATLTAEQRTEIDELMRSLRISRDALNEVSASPVSAGTPVFLLVHGLGLGGESDAWQRPIREIRKRGLQAYFFKWSKWRSLTRSADRLVAAIEEIRELHPGRKIVVVAHCSGGVIGLMALSRIQPWAERSEVFLHTTASPVFGYQAPLIAYAGAPFVGKATIELGRGSRDRIGGAKLQGCMNWINTRCDLDKHACLREGVSPQAGAPSSKLAELPCMEARVGAWTHEEIIQKAVDYALEEAE
jgi:hypothetical protein